jgi:hypothetical protein
VTTLDVIASLLGVAAGVLVGIGTHLRPILGRVAALLTLAAAVGIGSGVLPDVVALVVVPGCFVMATMAWRWSRLPLPAHRSFRQFDRKTRSTVVIAETAGTWPSVVGSAVAGVVAAWSMTSWRTVGAGAVGILAIAGLAVSAVAMRSEAGEPSADGPEVPSGRVTLIPIDSHDDGRRVEAMADRIRSTGMSVAVVVHPPHLFRGLAGWNLGLGLDAEQAAWAGQLARTVGLGPVLAEPGPLLSDDDATKLLICRALATGDDIVLLDEPATGLAASDMRDMARLVARVLGDRRLIITTVDPTGHQSFVARVLSLS